MSQRISLIPYPLEISTSENFFKFKKLTVSSQFSDELNFQLIIELSLKTLFTCGPSHGRNANIKIFKQPNYEEYDFSDPESYYLSVTEKEIRIYAAEDVGAYYGTMTLIQIIMQYQHELPCVEIYDKPAFKWRGFLLDTSRSFYTVDFIKKIIDLLAFHKINVFHWHLTDDQGWRLPVKDYPLLTELGSKRLAARKPLVLEGLNEDNSYRDRFYTEAEIKSIVKHAADKFITVVPEVDLPGHSSALLAAYPEFGCTGGPYQVEHRWGIFPDVLCAGNDKIFDLYDSVFNTLSQLFPGQYVHIGGDECPTTRWDRCPKCQKKMRELGLVNSKQLQTYITSKMVALLKKYDKIAIGWDEVLDNTEKFPTPPDMIVQSWRNQRGGLLATKLNHKVILSPQAMCYLNLKPLDNFEEPGMLGVTTIQKAYDYTPHVQGVKQENSDNILGGECALWTEEVRSSRLAEYLIFPRLCAIAEGLWLPESRKKFRRFLDNLDSHKKRLEQLDVLYYKGPEK